ncbi:hypothetical protein KSS87_018928 [Heliosperma pusillum]|nr:hypothetical protein KSS87_018928 [Heliosperma pusillum]
MGEEIPIIDMQEKEVNKVREACEKWGCFRVVNHGVPTKLMAEIKSVAVELFDRTVDIKQRNKEGEIIESYAQNMHNLGIEIANRMVGSSGQDGDNVKVCPSHFRMNKYTIAQENIGAGGLPMHTDASLFTILLDDEHFGGLEIVDPSGKLLAVDRFPDSFLINLGDIAVVITYILFHLPRC